MEAKKVILLLLICSLLSLFAMPAFADSITNYTIKNQVPLNQNLTITGNFTADSNVNANVLCSFYLQDQYYTLIARADDQYTDSKGNFASIFKVTEPDFPRETSFRAKTVCGNAEAIETFTVMQKQEAIDIFGFKFFPQGALLDTKYFTDPANTGILVIIFATILILGGGIVAVWRNKR